MSQERPLRLPRHPKKKQRVSAEPDLSEPEDYADFTEPRHEGMAEFSTVIVGDETETSSAVQSIQQVHVHILTRLADLLFNKMSSFFLFLLLKTTVSLGAVKAAILIIKKVLKSTIKRC